MIICFYIEVADEAEQVKVERAMAAPFIDAGKVSDLSLEEFDLARLNAGGSGQRKAVAASSQGGARRDGHSALRFKDGKLESFDLHPNIGGEMHISSTREGYICVFGKESRTAASWPEFISWLVCHGKEALGATTGCSEAQPLQPTIEVRPYKFPNGNDSCFEVVLGKVQLIIFADKGMADRFADEVRAEFFSAPPALSFDPARCEVHGVTMESCRKDKRSGCRAAGDPPDMPAKLPEGKAPNYDTPETIVEHIIGMVADDGSITDYARELATDYVCTRLLYAGGNYPLSSPQLEQVAREAAKEIFAKVFSFDPIRAEKIEKIILKWIQRHFLGSEGAAHRIPENENQAEATCSFEFKGEVCGKILRASSYRHAFLQSEPINMFNHVFQGAASPSVVAAVGCSKCGCKKGDTCGHKSCKFGEFCDFTGTRASPPVAAAEEREPMSQVCRHCREEKAVHFVVNGMSVCSINGPHDIPLLTFEPAPSADGRRDDEIPRRNRALVSAIRSDDKGLIDCAAVLEMEGMPEWAERLRKYALVLEAAVVRNEFPAPAPVSGEGREKL